MLGVACLGLTVPLAVAVLPPLTDEQMAAERAAIEALRQRASEYLTLRITAVSTREDGDTTWLTADAVVLEPHRSALGLAAGDRVRVRYGAQWKRVERFWQELETKAAAGYAGPGIESLPAQPLRLEAEALIDAWLQPSTTQGQALLQPAAGPHSFRRADVPPRE